MVLSKDIWHDGNISESAISPWIIPIVYVDRGARLPISWPNLGHKAAICGLLSPQFIVGKGYYISEVK